MSKKLNLIALMILLIGQIILGPMGSGNFVYAEGGDGEAQTDTVETPSEDPAPTEPTPTEPTPTEPTPTEPTPTEPTPTEPTPTEPTPTEPTPMEPTPTESTPTESTPTESTPTEPTPTEPTPTDPTPTDQVPTDPAPPDPVPTDPPPVDKPDVKQCFNEENEEIDCESELSNPVDPMLPNNFMEPQTFGNASVTLFKYFKDGNQKIKLPGAKFELEEQKRTRKCGFGCGKWSDWGNWSKVATDTTNSNGYITINGSVVKNDTYTAQYQYRFKEVTSPTGFTWDSSQYSITFKYESMYGNQLEFENKLKPNHYWCNGKAGTNPCDATVTVYKKGPNNTEYPNPIEINLVHHGHYDENNPLKADASGSSPAVFTGVHNGDTHFWEGPTDGKFCKLLDEQGNILVETTGDDYEFTGHRFVVNNGKNAPPNKNYIFTIVNAPPGMNCDGTLIPENGGTITITKMFQKMFGVDQWREGDESLTATFILVDVAGNELKSEQTTGDNGKTTFTGLEYGKTYYVKEVRTSNDAVYALDPDYDGTKNGITITANNKSPEITVKNTKKLIVHEGKIIVTKKGDYKVKGQYPTLSGAYFELFTKQGGTYVTTGQIVGPTDANGIAEFTGLEKGKTYYVKEKTAPKYHKLNNEYHEAKIPQSGTQSIDVKNEKLDKGKIKIKKVDQNNNIMQGVTFDLYEEDGTRVGRATTHSNGYAEFTDLYFGTYKAKEVVPVGYEVTTDNEGYVIPDGAQTSAMTVESKNKWKDVTVTNRQIIIPPLGSVILTKVDFDNPQVTLPSAKFKLQQLLEMQWGDVTGQTDLETDANGQIVVNNLPPGTYKFVETKAPEGYEIFGSGESTPFVNFGPGIPPISVTVSNQKITGSVTLNKTDSVSNKPLNGVDFKLYKVGNPDQPIPNGNSDVWTTSGAGAIMVSGLPYGNYYFVEVAPLPGYAPNTLQHGFVIDDNNHSATVGVKNTPLYGSLEVTKKGIDPDDPNKQDEIELPGAQFTLMDINGRYYTDQGVSSTDVVYLTTEADGKLTVSNLPKGEYTLTETSAPHGYEIGATSSWPITIAVGVQTNKLVENDLRTGSVTLTKTGDLGVLLDGATFDLYRGTPPAPPVPLALPAPYISGLITGTDGPTGQIVVDGLPVGNYYFVETDAPAGYMLDATPRTFEITIQGDLLAEVPVPNVLGKGSVTFVKVDEEDGETPLPGAIFTLNFKAPGESDYQPLGVQATSGPDGTVLFENLAYGDYQLIEVVAPQYYVLDATPIEFTISQDNEDVNLEIVTNEKGGDIVIEKVDEDNPDLKLAGAVFELKQGDVKVGEPQTTGEDGIAIFAGIPYGEYTLIEVTPPADYFITMSDEGIAVDLEEGLDEKREVVTNKKINEGFKVIKVSSSNPDTRLAGAIFKLQVKNDADVYVDYEGNIGQIITAGNGESAVFELPPGDYQIVETQAPANYTGVGTTAQFTIIENQTEIVEVIVINTPTSTPPPVTPPGPGPGPEPEPGTGSVTLAKVDVATDEGLGEAVFSLYRVGETDPIQTGLTTDTAGNLTVNNLEPGDYYFVETTAPTGYVLDATTQHSFTITASQLALVEVTNTKFTGSVTLFKKDSESDEGLSGAVFSLYQDGEDEAIQTGLTTNADGNLTVSGLAAGGYYFVETAAPEGYVLDGTPRPFTISSTQIANVQVEVANTAISDTTGSVTLYKVNSDTGEALNGATFAIYRVVDGEEDTLVLGGLITGGVGQPDGYISASDLPMGSYYIIETAAPEGYELGDTPPRIDFNITAGMTAVLDLGTVANTPETTGGGGGGGGGGGSGGGPTPTPVTPTPSPETPNEEVEETPQPESPNEEVEETPLPESPNVPVEETPQPEAPIIVEEQPQPEAPSVTVEKPSKPESPSVTVKEQPRPQASKVSPTLPRTGEEMPIATLIGGLVLIMLGGWLLLGRRKRNKTQM